MQQKPKPKKRPNSPKTCPMHPRQVSSPASCRHRSRLRLPRRLPASPAASPTYSVGLRKPSPQASYMSNSRSIASRSRSRLEFAEHEVGGIVRQQQARIMLHQVSRRDTSRPQENRRSPTTAAPSDGQSRASRCHRRTGDRRSSSRDDLIGDHEKLRQIHPAEARGQRDVGGVAARRHQDAADPRQRCAGHRRCTTGPNR